MSPKRQKKDLDLSFLTALTAPVSATSSKSGTGIFSASMSTNHPSQLVDIDLLFDNPYQPRARMDQQQLEELSQTIHDQGFLGVLVARPHPEQAGAFQISAGHRRREAARLAGWRSIPIIVQDISDQDMAIITTTENLQREDLNPVEEGRIFLLMMREFGLTQEQVATAIKKKRGYVVNRLRVAEASDDIQQFVLQKPDSLRAVSYLIQIEELDKRTTIITGLLSGQLTVDDVPHYLKAPESSLPVSASMLSQNAEEHSHAQHTAEEPGMQRQASIIERTDVLAALSDTPSSPHSTPPLPPQEVQEKREEYVAARVGLSKLQKSLHTLQEYRLSLRARKHPVSPAEQKILAQLTEVITTLCTEAQLSE